MNRGRIFTVWATALLLAPFAQAQVPTSTVELGIVDEVSQGREGPFIEETVDALRKSFAREEMALNVTRGSGEEIARRVRQNRLDLFIAPSDLYRQLLLSGCSDIAVTHDTRTSNPNRSQGALFLSRLGEEPVFDRAVKEGKVLRLGGETSSASIRGELFNQGLSGRRSADLLAKIPVRPAGDKEMEDALRKLRQSRLDLLILPVCRLERYCGDHSCATADLGVLWPKQDTDMTCFHSTQLYPGTTLVATPGLSPFAHREILSTIFALQSKENGQRWHVATNFQTTDQTLRLLDDDAWTRMRQSSIRSFLERRKGWIIFGLCALGFFVVHTIVLQILVRRKTRELRRALSEQKRARRETELISRRLEKQRRLQTIGQMASLFAHELGQPLNAIGCYAHGIGKATENVEKRRAVEKGIRGIEEEVGRASAIVNRVRDYVRSQTMRDGVIDLEALIRGAVRNFGLTSLGNVPVILERKEPERVLRVRGDSLELELIVTNLLRNASQALQAVMRPEIRVTVFGGPNPGFSVADNGTGLTEEKLADIVRIGESTRPEGLGLGLSIVRDLVALHGGRIEFSLTGEGGLKVTVTFPPARESEKGEES